MGTLKYWNALFIQLLVSFIILAPVNLYSQEYFITESYFIDDIYSCDLDLDGDHDLIISSTYNGSHADSLFIFYNDGIGNLNKTSIHRRNGIFVRCGNIDNDEYPDIITKDASDILCIKNNGDGTFGDEIILAPTLSNRVIEYIADMDGDGLNDLVYTYNGYYCEWGILRNEGDLLFTEHIIYNDASGTNLSPIIGNLNNDNLPDACLEFTTEGIHVLINNGDLTFDSLLLCSTKGYAAICNLDLNSPQDILVLGPNTDELILYENLGNSVFMDRNTLPLIDALALNAVADFNNDGYDDLGYSICWWTGYTDSIYIRMNDQNWNFYKPQQYYVGPMEMFMTEIADLNGDSFNDIIMYGYSPRNAFKILWNDGFGSFSYENPVGIKENYNQPNKLKIVIGPNPFKEQTTFSFSLSEDSDVSLSIYDQLGRIVHSYPVRYYEKGNQSIDFRNDRLSPGVYYYKISVNNKFLDAGKLMVL